MLDPPSAIGVAASMPADVPPAVPVVTLATAHPAKFPDAIKSAGLEQSVDLPLHLTDLFERPERLEVLPNDLAAVQAYMANSISA